MIIRRVDIKTAVRDALNDADISRQLVANVEDKLSSLIARRYGPVTDEPRTFDYRRHLVGGKLSEACSAEEYVINSALLAIDHDRDGIVTCSLLDLVTAIDELNQRFARATVTKGPTI